jgi:hypothetical protein
MPLLVLRHLGPPKEGKDPPERDSSPGERARLACPPVGRPRPVAATPRRKLCAQ